jgi:predicted dehydrogenase
MMTKTLRWGILGAAKFAREHMGPAIHMAPYNDLVAIATSSAEKATPFQAMRPGMMVHLDYDDLLNDPNVDAVYIPLPNHMHIEWAKRAIAAGKHVLCEKPISMQASEIDELIALRDASNLLVAEAYMIVHHPQWHYARELVQSGAIGTLIQVDGVFSYNNAADVDNIRNRSDAGGGGLRDIGVYTFGSTRFVTGQEPTEVQFADIKWENGIDAWAHVAAKFPDFRFSGVTSMRMAPRQEMNFHGDKGWIKLTAPFNPSVFDQAEVHLMRDDMVVETKRFPTVNHYVNQVVNFRAAVIDGATYPCPLEFSRGTQAMIDMAFDKAGD